MMANFYGAGGIGMGMAGLPPSHPAAQRFMALGGGFPPGTAGFAQPPARAKPERNKVPREPTKYNIHMRGANTRQCAWRLCVLRGLTD